ncbi:potassium channel family protein [uncultured Lentibacter sp.]|uniref:potassium channel family protein n=1 Tax=uncultured Lentibacter sp. TaxID=1659309 RepID=UPI00260D86AE|nr:potassium channel family protein [uncultured Lentibacter sp.]MCW1955475.1 potassium channel family protein [Roseobacter sp.]
MTLTTRSILSLLALVVVSGTVFFRLVEGWSWIDAYFFTVVTLSTVGYGNLVPATVLGKIGTTVFIFTGLGIFALAIQQFGHFAFLKRRRKALESHRETTE